MAIPFVVGPSAHAASFYIQEQSVSGLGTAFAGAAASTPDASTIFYNPAGMTDLGQTQYSVGTHFIIPRAEYKNTGSTVSSLPGTGGATTVLQGTTGDNPFGPEVVPNAYLAFPLSDGKSWWGGFGISAPFGLTNKYDDDFFGRYDSTENSLRVIDFAPSIAWAPNDFISIGGGIDVQYVDAKLGAAVPSPITSGGPTPATDGETDLSGQDITAGFNAGMILKPTEKTRIGAHYRQGVSHTLDGRLVTRVPSDVPTLGGTHAITSGSAELDLPNIVNFGVAQQVNDKLTILGSANWYEWSNFNDIPVGLAGGASSQSFQNYEDTWGFALGARYKMDEKLLLKAGIQYDPTPSVDNFRSTRVPDGDRLWIAAGATYDLDKNWSLDFAAAYVNVSKESINLSGTVPISTASTTYNIRGEVEGDVGIFSAALKYKFDTPY